VISAYQQSGVYRASNSRVNIYRCHNRKPQHGRHIGFAKCSADLGDNYYSIGLDSGGSGSAQR